MKSAATPSSAAAPDSQMFLSVVICTYRRIQSVRALLECLMCQHATDFEVLLIDGSGNETPEHETFRRLVDIVAASIDIRLLSAPKGLTRQRNAGIQAARGDILLFFDDDVTFGSNFLAQTRTLFQRPDFQDVGGIGGYDTCNYGRPVSFRWRLRSLLGVVPRLRPGAIDRLGRSIPVSLAKPFSGCLPVGYLYGFCMLFRRAAIGDLRFDEQLDTYAGEDRDFSARVARNWRLLLCGDLTLEHHGDPEFRDSDVQRTYQAGFGTGRTLRKNASRRTDFLELLHVLLGEFLIDTLALCAAPNLDHLRATFARAGGLLDGWHSIAPKLEPAQ